jgi:hypothetical protein
VDVPLAAAGSFIGRRHAHVSTVFLSEDTQGFSAFSCWNNGFLEGNIEKTDRTVHRHVNDFAIEMCCVDCMRTLEA